MNVDFITEEYILFCIVIGNNLYTEQMHSNGLVLQRARQFTELVSVKTLTKTHFIEKSFSVI